MDRDASQISPSAQGYDLDSYPGGVNFDGVPEFVEKVEAAAADESTPEPIVLVLGTADNIAHALDADEDASRGVELRVEFTR